MIDVRRDLPMSRKGNCWDNAPTESWFTSFKNERCLASALQHVMA